MNLSGINPTENPGRKWGKTGVFFRTQILMHDSDDCLIWPYAVGSNGYGFMTHNGRVQTVHRLTCATVHGEPPSQEHDAAHSCGNKLCCNPAHLRWATRAENNADKLVHGTHDRGERHARSKYTEEQVRQLHATAKLQSIRSAAATLGMNYSVAYKIIKGKSWPHMSSKECAA